MAAQISEPDELTTLLVEGVEDNQAQLDEVIAAHAKGWTLARMPTIDRTVLRIAGFELLGRPDVPVAVVLNEAVELAKRFSTDDSGRFVNGVLSCAGSRAPTGCLTHGSSRHVSSRRDRRGRSRLRRGR